MFLIVIIVIEGVIVMDSNVTKQPFVVDFSEQIIYYDKNYSGVFIVIDGKAEITSADFKGDAKSILYVKNIIGQALSQHLQICSSKGKSYKRLEEEIPALKEACVFELMQKHFDVYNFSITSVVQNDDNLKTIDKLDLSKVMADMN
jgi:hypothetical protein